MIPLLSVPLPLQESSAEDVHYLQPFEKETNTLRFSVVEGKEQIDELIQKIKTIKGER